MALMPLIIALAVLGIVIWVITTYLPIDGMIKHLIIIVAIAFVGIWFLQQMGWIGSVRGRNDITIR